MIWNRQASEDDPRTQPRDDEAGGARLQPDITSILDSITRAIPDPFMMLDDAGTILSHNRQAKELTGQNMVGQHLSQHIRAPAVLEAANDCKYFNS